MSNSDDGSHGDKSVKGKPANKENNKMKKSLVQVAAEAVGLGQGLPTQPPPSANMGGADTGDVVMPGNITSEITVIYARRIKFFWCCCAYLVVIWF